MKTIQLPKPILPEWATLEYDNGVTAFDPSTLVLHLEKEQRDSYIPGTEMQRRLSNEGSANLATLQYLQKHHKLLPEGWNKNYAIYGWGTIVRDRNGDLGVPYLIEDGGQVVLLWSWLDYNWSERSPALRFASQSSVSEPVSELGALELRVKNLEQQVEKIQHLDTLPLELPDELTINGVRSRSPHISS